MLQLLQRKNKANPTGPYRFKYPNGPETGSAILQAGPNLKDAHTAYDGIGFAPLLDKVAVQKQLGFRLPFGAAALNAVVIMPHPEGIGLDREEIDARRDPVSLLCFDRGEQPDPLQPRLVVATHHQIGELARLHEAGGSAQDLAKSDMPEMLMLRENEGRYLGRGGVEVEGPAPWAPPMEQFDEADRSARLRYISHLQGMIGMTAQGGLWVENYRNNAIYVIHGPHAAK